MAIFVILVAAGVTYEEYTGEDMGFKRVIHTVGESVYDFRARASGTGSQSLGL